MYLYYFLWGKEGGMVIMGGNVRLMSEVIYCELVY